MNMAVIFVTHDLGLVARFAHTVAVMYAGRFIETGPAEEIFARPRHPYTQGLLGSIPAITGERPGRLTQIPGSPPDLATLGAGCPFEPRCAFAMERCHVERPSLAHVAGNVHTACWIDTETQITTREVALVAR
jgi:oligopeptide/dipeptide ABC transporter ATP-binding protein